MATFGEDLKRERELRDISIEEIARATNISRSFLEAIEQNNFAILPGGAYTRGFIRAYARHVGINVEETLDAFNAELERGQAAAAGAPGPAVLRAVSPHAGRAAEAVVALVMVAATLMVGIAYWTGGTDGATPAPGDPEAHEAALRARFKKAGTLPSLPGIPDGSVAGEPVRAQAGAPQAAEDPGPEVIVRLRARETTGVQLTCSGRVQFDGELWVGAERHFPCRGSIYISAGNGGALEVAVGEEELRALGRPGERVQRRRIGGSSGSAPPDGG